LILTIAEVFVKRITSEEQLEVNETVKGHAIAEILTGLSQLAISAVLLVGAYHVFHAGHVPLAAVLVTLAIRTA
jgi:hypothetical protein